MKNQIGKKGVTRRVFIGASGSAAAGLLVGCSEDAASASSTVDAATGQDVLAGDPDVPGDASIEDASNDPDLAQEVAEGPDLVLRAGQVAVAIVGYDSDLEAALRQAVALAGGIDAIQPGETVFIKPNAVHPFATEGGVVTSAEMVAAVVRLVAERGAGRIVVGDRSARGFDSQASLEESGMKKAALKAGADEIYAAKSPVDDPDAWVLVQPPGWEATWGTLEGVLALRQIIEADHFINLAVCKDHRWAGFSLSMKNLMGAVGDESRDKMHYVKNDVDTLSHDIVVLNGAFTPLLNIIDATWCMVNGGPEGILGDAVTSNPKRILASRDRVALDAMGAALLHIEQAKAEIASPDAVQGLLRDTATWQLPQIVRGVAAGLGVASADAVVLRFDGVGDAQALEDRFRGKV